MARGHKTGGRQKGTPNKINRELRMMVLEALDRAGGADYLYQQAKTKNPTAFMALLGRILPSEVKAEVGIRPLREWSDEELAIAAATLDQPRDTQH